MFKVENPDDLPIVKTVYDIHLLNEYTAKGHRSVIVPVVKNSALEQTFCIFKNKVNGSLEEAPGRTFYVQYGRIVEYLEEDWDLVFSGHYYVRERSVNRTWAGYVLPIGIQPDTRVYIEDIIEDVKVGEFWHAIHYAEDAIGQWNGERIELDFDVFTDRYTPLIG